MLADNLSTTNLQRTPGRHAKHAYQQLFAQMLPAESVAAIREALNRNHIFGGERFQQHVEAMLGRRLGSGQPGRPKRSAQERSGAVR